ncbi:MAG: hypothetical protein IJP23_03255 [Oscillospiraceae bacterium]|nr:hypothetical protein [Oscillospiraceae bacterium]
MDSKTLAYINLHGILANLVWLCQMDDEAKKLIEGVDIALAIEVKDGPSGTLTFRDGKCTYAEGVGKCDIKLPFSSCDKFNGMINGTVTPFPSKGLLKIGFLLKTFTKLTDILESYLRPAPEKLEDPVFFKKSTELMFHLIASAVSQIGNHDRIGKHSASYIVDGNVKLGIENGIAMQIVAKDSHLTTLHTCPEDCTAYMMFENINTARDLFDGKVNAVVCVGLGQVRIGGMISMVDNINRILDRVAVYLA